MEFDQYPSVSLHNVAEIEPAEWDADGDRLHRIPSSVGAELNEMAQDRVRHPTASEVRFVPTEEDAEIEVTLSAAEETEFRAFWGVHQPWEPTEVGPTPETYTFSVPERLREITGTDETGRFDPQVCRLRFERRTAIAIHDVSGDCRPPRDSELPDQRYLTYGTSITEGAAASALHMDYVTHVARERGYDLLNFGTSGSAYAEAAMAEYIASREDWDVATLELSVNMANAEFTPVEFRDRVEFFLNTIADAHPDKPIACLTLFPYFDDLTESGDRAHAKAFRDAVRDIVAESPHENLHVVEGADLNDITGLTADLLHPGDAGMERIGNGLASHLAEIID
ncbi:lipolytic protein G-D-S-L family protein [Halorhabdus tiamatea SARL4B]|uniref:Esterase, SGNH hydrolase-type n=1 Tax=Halorhabdus tiamatea SARL4B TaxID=1033806 RepID=F7PG88_9EURY|nr:SGNH/GDSL hydrolase family protein [Halorhabdus tiamatea]ERJ06312.1 lipolytic protein G-D-S-L family protein [Halorhabdus tiamatea SARL4B]CCQ34635.1 esterase, SGNH hydrolase-type [Halorhabdus tiamatea SARL4B]